MARKSHSRDTGTSKRYRDFDQYNMENYGSNMPISNDFFEGNQQPAYPEYSEYQATEYMPVEYTQNLYVPEPEQDQYDALYGQELGDVGPDGTVYVSNEEFEMDQSGLEYVDTAPPVENALVPAKKKRKKHGSRSSSKRHDDMAADVEYAQYAEEAVAVEAVPVKKSSKKHPPKPVQEIEDRKNVFYDADTVVEKAEFENIDISREESRGSIPYRDLRDMCIQFSKINDSGVSIVDTIRILIEQTENNTLRDALESVYEQVKSGEDLSAAMSNCACFPFAFTIAISAAEKNDLVALAFKRFGDIFDREEEQREMHRMTMFYPTLVTACALVVMIIMMLVVYPNFVNMFSELGTDLPQLSKALLSAASTFNRIWGALSIVFVLVLIGIFIFKKMSNADLLGSRLGASSLPTGSFKRMNVYAKFARYMNALLEVGVATKDALFVTAHSFTEYPFLTARLLDAANAAAAGSTLSNALCVFDFFPIMILQMISVGEEMGDTPLMLMHVAEYYEEEARRDAAKRVARNEPVSIVIMAIVVLFLLVSMLQPVLKFYELVNQL